MDNPELHKGDVLYWTKIVPCCGEFHPVQVKVHTLRDDYFTCTDMTSKKTYLFGYDALDKSVFANKLDAELTCASAEEEYYATHDKLKYSIDKGDDD